MQLLYLGFTQEANTRHYRFEGVVPKEKPVRKSANLEFIMNTDMALLAEFHIRFQDVPILCLEILARELLTAETAPGCVTYTVTSMDLSFHAKAKSAIEAAKPPRRRPRAQFKPDEASQPK